MDLRGFRPKTAAAASALGVLAAEPHLRRVCCCTTPAPTGKPLKRTSPGCHRSVVWLEAGASRDKAGEVLAALSERRRTPTC